MKKFNFLVLFILFLSSSVYGQKISNLQKKVPVSIYTIQGIKDVNGFSLLNKKLKLNSFDFIFTDLIDLDTGFASIAFKDIGKTPTKLIYDDYKSYYDNNFLKGFLLKYDPTRSINHCEPNHIVQ